MSKNYDGSNIQVLKGLEAVRKRPGMYVGDTGSKGLHHLFKEIFDNSKDEYLAGHCSKISVILDKEGNHITVEDNGRGIPTDMHPTEGISTIEVVFTVLHAGGKFDNESYQGGSGGLHGVGASCVNALSEELNVVVWRNEQEHQISFSKGDVKSQLKKTKDLKGQDKNKTGTRVSFKADSEIFREGISFDEDIIINILRESSFLNRGLEISFKNEKTGTEQIFKSDGGISDYVLYLVDGREEKYPSVPFYFESTDSIREGKIKTEISLIYTDMDGDNIFSFANNINTSDGGTHLSGFKNSFTRVVNAYGRKLEVLKEKDDNLSGDDIRDGMTAIISVRFPQPEFVGQTKNKLGTLEVEGIVSSVLSKGLGEFFDKNPAIAKKIVQRALICQQARQYAKKQTDLIKRKSLFSNGRLPGKLSDCSSKNKDKTEIYICEGDSAGGGCVQGRNSSFQAILPLKGKIINAEKATLGQLMKNDEIQNIIIALGCGVKDSFDISKLRYSKVILCCDSDSDGKHIAVLLLTFFYRFMKDLIINGNIYTVEAPFYKIIVGKDIKYCWTETELKSITSQIKTKYRVVRFKGLGEMNPDELSETTMQVGKRRLIQIKMDDAIAAEKALVNLMGNDSAVRKEHMIKEFQKRVALHV